MKDLRNS